MAAQPDDRPVLDLLASMTADSLEASNLDTETLMLVRIAALVAVDAPAGSYLMNLGVAADSGVEAEQIQGVLAAVAPIVGAPRVVSAAGRMADALGVAIDLSQAGAS
jgi:alkylhydroperoxidase/carboxymuconolactone decarboxylase family protein YurZ